MLFARIKISEKTCWQKKTFADQKQCMAEWTIWTPSTNNQPHTGIWSSTVRACSYRYYLMKNNIKWTISIPTTSPCEVRLFELAAEGTILSVLWKTTKTLALANLENFASGKKASRRKWKSENETENPNTSYLAIITEK